MSEVSGVLGSSASEAPDDARLEALRRAGVFEEIDLHVAEALVRLGGVFGEARADVQLAVALASRAPRHGHVCVELDEIHERVSELLHLEKSPQVPTSLMRGWPSFEAWRRTLAGCSLVDCEPDARRVVRPLVLDGARLYLERYWRYQQRVVEVLEARSAHLPDDLDPARLRDGLDRLFPDDGAHPGSLDRQRLAGAVAVLRRFCVVSGGPGTGKTTTVKKILSLLLEQAGRPDALRIALAAPTGKAAARMQDSIREELDELPVEPGVRQALSALPAFTIHRLLGVMPERSSRFRHHASHPLPYDVVVVDEASMISLPLMAKLLDAVAPAARLILLGDQDQLASVEAGAVLGDICSPGRGRPRFSTSFARSVDEAAGLELAALAARGLVSLVDDGGIWDCIVQLDRFYRFGQDSGIGGVARAIQRADEAPRDALDYLQGLRTEKGEGRYGDVRLVDAASVTRGAATGGVAVVPSEVLAAAEEGFGPLVRAALADAPPGEVLEALGKVAILCPHRRGELGVEGLNLAIERHLARRVEGFDAGQRWSVGRPVMVTQNDYSVRLYNGDVGVVVRDPAAPGEAGRRMVAFPGREPGVVRLVGVSRLPPVESVFAMSIHKSQGSQFDHAVVVLPTRASPIMTRELIYTAITRARRQVTVVGDPTMLAGALGRRVTRPSGLGPKLWTSE